MAFSCRGYYGVDAQWIGGIYTNLHKLPTGEYASIAENVMIDTWSLFVGINEDGTSCRVRYIYPDRKGATWGKLTWDGKGDPPGDWLRKIEMNG